MKKLYPLMLILLLPAFANAQEKELTESFNQVSEYIHNILGDYEGAGSYVTIVKDQETIYENMNGLANVEHQVPMKSQTVFDMASIAKMFTGYAIAVLEEEGKLSSEDDIRTYLPDFPDYGPTITIAHLLHHTSGVKNWTTLLRTMNWPFDDRINFDQLVRLGYAQSELDFEPGSRYQYSNTGYVLLVSIFEKASGESFVEWTQENIFDPLAMESSFINDQHNRIIRNRADGHYLNPYREEVKSYNNTTALGSSSLFSTGPDMTKWMNFLLNPPADKKAYVDRMMTTKPFNNGEMNTYAYGIDVEEYKGMRFINHSGGWASNRTHLVLLPDHNAAIFIGHNFRIGTSAIVNLYADAFTEKGVELNDTDDDSESDSSEEEEKVTLSNEQLDKYLGTFQLGKAWFVNITRRGNQLFTTANGEDSFPMEVVNENTFLVRGYGNRTIEFNHDSNGEVESITYNKEVRPKFKLQDEQKLDEFKEFEGVYYSTELELLFTFEVGKDALYAKSIKQGNLKLNLIEDELFFGEGVLGSVLFNRDESGKVIGFSTTNSRGIKRDSFKRASL